ncbi:hypothetical protein VDG1235_2643 [Verrucomicrobiia bacterium DG1235]|nr:hypothetical protein VDG1235_2643 [Verrucomicrobiae bacterium DG1235]
MASVRFMPMSAQRSIAKSFCARRFDFRNRGQGCDQTAEFK